MRTRTLGIALLTTLAFGCSETPADSSASAAGGGSTSTAGGGADDDGGTQAGPGWTMDTHPCSGNRTDALWVDADGTLFVGCGSTTTGDQGFYYSEDDGETWNAPTTTPNGFFDTWRVLDISRSADGLLYVAGNDTASDRRVVSVDTSVSPWALDEVYNSAGTVSTSFNVGGFRRASDGFAIAESHTGTGIQYRTSDEGEWMDGSSWDDEQAAGGFQILHLVLHDDEFYGSGSTISVPPQLFLPLSAGGFGFHAVQLANGIGAFDGEMWGLAVDDSGIVIGGVNQNRNVGMIYAMDDGFDGSGTLRTFDVSIFYPDDTSWIRGVCRNGETLVAVGELSSKNEGIVLRSIDNGSTWNNITPQGDTLGPVHRCHVFDDGRVLAVGAGGTVATYR